MEFDAEAVQEVVQGYFRGVDVHDFSVAVVQVHAFVQWMLRRGLVLVLAQVHGLAVEIEKEVEVVVDFLGLGLVGGEPENQGRDNQGGQSVDDEFLVHAFASGEVAVRAEHVGRVLVVLLEFPAKEVEEVAGVHLLLVVDEVVQGLDGLGRDALALALVHVGAGAGPVDAAIRFFLVKGFLVALSLHDVQRVRHARYPKLMVPLAININSQPNAIMVRPEARRM